MWLGILEKAENTQLEGGWQENFEQKGLNVEYG